MAGLLWPLQGPVVQLTGKAEVKSRLLANPSFLFCHLAIATEHAQVALNLEKSREDNHTQALSL